MTHEPGYYKQLLETLLKTPAQAWCTMVRSSGDRTQYECKNDRKLTDDRRHPTV